MIDFFNIPRSNGDCVVLLLVHPGPNFLSRYLPASKINDLLLAETRIRPTSSHGMDVDETSIMDGTDAVDVMDLASFLE